MPILGWLRQFRRHAGEVKDDLPSVIIPKVPSAPMKSFVKSKPDADFLARLLVLMTSPLGSTTV